LLTLGADWLVDGASALAKRFGISNLVGRLLRLQRPKSVALSIEVGKQNSGLGGSVSRNHGIAVSRRESGQSDCQVMEERETRG